VRVTGKCLSPLKTSFPVLAASRTDCSVAAPVLLVVSEVEFQTADKAVYIAVTVEGLGAGIGVTGQTPAEFGPFVSALSVPLPTTLLLLESNSAPPEAPAPTLPTTLTTPQNVEE